MLRHFRAPLARIAHAYARGNASVPTRPLPPWVSSTGDGTHLARHASLASSQARGTEHIDVVSSSPPLANPQQPSQEGAPARAPLHPPPPLPPPPALLDIGLPPPVASGMAALGISMPTDIQTRTVPRVLSGAHTLIAAETGSGKTLAYLAPLVARLKASDPPRELRRPRRPRAIVLVPTRELVMQVVGVARKLAQVSRISVREALGGGGSTALRRWSLRKALEEVPLDLLVATPGMLQKMRDEKLVLLSELQTVVIDEADVTLAAQGFEQQVAPFLAAVDTKPALNPPQTPAQFVYAAASLPASVRWLIEQRHERDNLTHVSAAQKARGEEPTLITASARGGELQLAQTSELHVATPARRVQTRFIRVSGGESQKLKRAAAAVCELVKDRKGKAEKIMLFCDRDNRREQLVEMLEEGLPHGVGVVHMSAGSMGDRYDRWRDWNRFREDDGDVRVAVCAQSFSRGIDLPSIKHVVMTDVPMTGPEYLHRVGRIRAPNADASASVTVLVSGRDRAIAEALFLAHVREDDLSALNAPAAWRAYVDASQDRIATDPLVATARRKRQALWIDERSYDGSGDQSRDKSGSSSRSFRGGNRGPASKAHSVGSGSSSREEWSSSSRHSRRLPWGRSSAGVGRGENVSSRDQQQHVSWKENKPRAWNAPPVRPPVRRRKDRPVDARRDNRRAARYESRKAADAGPYGGR